MAGSVLIIWIGPNIVRGKSVVSGKIERAYESLVPLIFTNEVLREWWSLFVRLDRLHFVAVCKHDHQFSWRTNGIPER